MTYVAETPAAGFVDQVKGYAKEFAGKTFNKEHEQARGSQSFMIINTVRRCFD